MIKKVVIALFILLAILATYAAVKPAEYTISRETTINAPAEAIFPYLNNPKLAEQWAPWMEIDPKATMTTSGPESGVGSVSSWVSETQLGTGSATIVESVPNERVGIKLAYSKPMAMEQDSLYLITSTGGQSVVTWKVSGKNTFMGRFMCLFVDMDKMVGAMFEKGLSNLKKLIETKAGGK
jgi:uncharacterized protein YndB with AHSA1/START domain